MVRADSITCSPPHHQIPFWRFFVTLFIVYIQNIKPLAKRVTRLFVAKIRKEVIFLDHLWSENYIRTKSFIDRIFEPKIAYLALVHKYGMFQSYHPMYCSKYRWWWNHWRKTIVWRVILSRFDRKCHGRTMFMGHTWRRFYSVMKTIDNTWSWFWKWSSDFCFLTLVNTSGRTTRKWGK